MLGHLGEALGAVKTVRPLGLRRDGAHQAQGEGAGDGRVHLGQPAGAQGAVTLQLAAGLGLQSDTDRSPAFARLQRAQEGVDGRLIFFGYHVAQGHAGQGIQFDSCDLLRRSQGEGYNASAIQLEQQIGAGESKSEIAVGIVGHKEPLVVPTLVLTPRLTTGGNAPNFFQT